VKISTCILLMGVGVLIGMAACGANDDQAGPPATTIPPDQAPTAVEPADRPQPEAAQKPTQPATVPPAREAAQEAAQTATQQTQQQAVQQTTQEQIPEPKVSPFATEKDKVSYILGTSVGTSLKQQNYDINFDPFVKGLADALEGRDLAMTPEEMNQVMMAYQQKMMAQQQVLGDKNISEGRAFLEQNKNQAGVVTLPSGLQYKILTPGTGPVPTALDSVKTHYRGTLLNGQEFDSSYSRNEPATFGVTQVIQGWQEALQLMKVGAKWQLFIPADLAYGPQGRPSIPPNSVLIFEIELLEITPK
jgi:FKBP-type peptidyl-prolyl cis-trans isomerase